jgi:hypothetical protein
LLEIEQKGKHGETNTVYDKWVDDDYYLINAPIAYIDHEYYDIFNNNRFMGIGKEKEARIQKYMKIEGEMQPILLAYGKMSLRDGWPTVCATNGNHRLEVAKRRGWTHVPALIPVSHYERWKAFHDSGREYWDQDKDKEMFKNHPLKVGQYEK